MSLRSTAIALLLSVCATAHATASPITIVDTGVDTTVVQKQVGQPVGTTAMVFAGEFSVASFYDLTSIESYFFDHNPPQSIDVRLYADGGGLPGTLLFSQTVNFSPTGGSSVWFGATGVNWSVGPGTYWAAFAISGQVSIFHPPVMPLNSYALAFEPQPFNVSTFRIPLRVQGVSSAAVPEPTSLLLLSSGLVALGILRRRTR